MKHWHFLLRRFLATLTFVQISCLWATPLTPTKKIEFIDGFGRNNLLLEQDLTQEDQRRCQQFNLLYDRFEQAKPIDQIPKKLHFIWLGPSQPQALFKHNILTWIEHHPDWEVNLWTDRPIESFHPALNVQHLEEKYIAILEDKYTQTLNFSERAALSAYALLLKNGGVYVDCDVECYQSIDPISDQCDFFCPVDCSKESCLASAIFADKYILGARPHHPILQSCIYHIHANWNRCTQSFIGLDKEAIRYRLKYRCIQPLTDAIFEKSTAESIVLPPLFFKSIADQKGLYGHHHHIEAVECSGPTFGNLLHDSFKKDIKKYNQFSLFLIIALSIFAFIQIGLLITWYKVLAVRLKNE